MTGPVHNGGLGVPAVSPPAPAGGARRGGAETGGVSFADELRRSTRTGGVEFSKHALQRLERRRIGADANTIRRLEGGIDRAAAKGARDAVVLIDDTAFVVSVRNRTVITAVDSAHMRDHVFTNIDSAAIA